MIFYKEIQDLNLILPLNSMVKMKVLVFLQSHAVKKTSIFSLLGLRGDGTANPGSCDDTII